VVVERNERIEQRGRSSILNARGAALSLSPG
jgi:hypothetical protein